VEGVDGDWMCEPGCPCGDEQSWVEKTKGDRVQNVADPLLHFLLSDMKKFLGPAQPGKWCGPPAC
jgi:hypothetical protein